MKNVFTIILALAFSVNFIAQEISDQDTNEIKNTIATLFEGMQKSDTLILNSVLEKNVNLRSYDYTQDTPKTIDSNREKFYESLQKLKAMNLDWKEQILRYQFLQDHEFVTVWTPYEFYVNGQKRHCGVNQFTVVKQNDNWMIHSVYDTRRKCDYGANL